MLLLGLTRAHLRSVIYRMNDSRARIVPYRDEHQPHFARLNLEWLEGHSLLEAADLPHLSDPRGSFIDTGGEVLIMLLGDDVVGTAAPKPVYDEIGEGAWELCKLAVDRQARGQGLGEQLVRSVIEAARERGAARLTLSSSSKLESALRLYRRMGFTAIAEGAAAAAMSGYASCDVILAMDIATS